MTAALRTERTMAGVVRLIDAQRGYVMSRIEFVEFELQLWPERVGLLLLSPVSFTATAEGNATLEFSMGGRVVFVGGGTWRSRNMRVGDTLHLTPESSL